MIVQLLNISPCDQPDILKIVLIIKTAVKIVFTIIPIVLILFGIIDLTKCVIASKEDEIKGHVKMLIKRIIYSIVIFFVPTIVLTVNHILGNLGVDYSRCLDNANKEKIAILRTMYNDYINTQQAQINTKISEKEVEKTTDSNNQTKKSGFNNIKSGKDETNSSDSSETTDDKSDDETSDSNKSEEYNDDYITWEKINYDNILEFVDNMEGTDTGKYLCDNGNGFKVIYDSICGSNATRYGITYNYVYKTLNDCSKLTSEEKTKYFSSSKFVTGACIPNEVVKKAAICIYDASAKFIISTFKSKCGMSEVKFKEQEWVAIMDEANSGIAYAKNSIAAYCSAYKSDNKSKANDALFKAYFAYKNSNPTCAYVARRDCEARVFFEGDSTCGGQNVYSTTYKYKYSKYLDTTHFSITSYKTCIKR